MQARLHTNAGWVHLRLKSANRLVAWISVRTWWSVQLSFVRLRALELCFWNSFFALAVQKWIIGSNPMYRKPTCLSVIWGRDLRTRCGSQQDLSQLHPLSCFILLVASRMVSAAVASWIASRGFNGQSARTYWPPKRNESGGRAGGVELWPCSRPSDFLIVSFQNWIRLRHKSGTSNYSIQLDLRLADSQAYTRSTLLHASTELWNCDTGFYNISRIQGKR